MDSIFSLLAHMNMNYIRGQLVLIPLFIAYALLRGKGLKISHLNFVNSGLLFMSLLFPLILSIDFSNLFSRAPGAIMMPPLVISAIVNKNISNQFLLPWYSIAGIIGLIGILCLIVQFSYQYFLEKKLLRSCVLFRKMKKVCLIVTNKISVPFSTGLINHRIYIPSRLYYEKGTREAVLRHEALHVRSGHTIIVFLEMLHRSLFWFNPLSHLLPTLCSITREHLCDEFVTAHHPVNEYCRLLLREAEFIHQSGGVVLSNALGKHALKNRIKYLLEGNMKKTSKFAVGVLLLSAISTAGLLIGIGYSDELVNSPSGKAINANKEIASTTTDSATRSSESVQKVILQNVSTLQKAYKERLVEKPALEGKITVKFAIDQSGTVCYFGVLEKTLNDEKLEFVVSSEVKRWKFGAIDKVGDITDVVYPFIFDKAQNAPIPTAYKK